VEDVIARHVLSAKFSDLDKQTVAATKHHVLHTLVTAVAGSNAPGIKPVLELAIESGAPGKSTTLVHGIRMTGMNAAMVNSTMSHAQDYDMNDDRTFYKSSVVVVPVALAIAEERGAVGGEELIAAICVGIDLGIRIGLAVTPKPAHVLSQMVGGFGAVAAAARLLGLDHEQFLDALGIAYCQVSASGSSTSSPALTKRLLPGLAARSAVFSARLAQKGFKGGRNVLRGAKGYFPQYHWSEGDHEEILSELGRRWEVVNVGPKGYPCCRVLHAPIDAALAVVRSNQIKPDEVESVTVRGSPTNIFLTSGNKAPVSTSKLRHPEGVVDAQFSVHWAVAAAITRGQVSVDCFTETAIKDPEINRLTERVELIGDESLDPDGILLAPAIVEVTTRNRGAFSHRTNHAKGNPNNPVTWQETEDALRQNAAHAAAPLDAVRIEEAIHFMRELESAKDVNALPPMLCAQHQAH
jgi:2-methylcitrate dehydratase PrpD